MAKILVVDDDPDFLEATANLLRAKNHEVATAPNGDDGYTMAKKDKPDLLLLDVMMTVDNEGFEMARKLKEDPATKAIPVIIITGIRQAKNLSYQFEPDHEWLPVKSVLEKPVKPDELIATVEAALQK